MFIWKSVCVHIHVQSKRSTGSNFGTEILKMVFEASKQLFLKIDRDFFRVISKNIFWFIWKSVSVYVHVHVQIKRPTGSNFGTKLLKMVFEASKQLFLKIDLDSFRVILKNIFLDFNAN